MLGISEEAALIRFLSAAPVLAEGWRDFLRALQQRTNASEAALSLRLRGREWHFATGPLILPDPLQSLRSERVYAQDEFAPGTPPIRLLALSQRGGLQARLAITHPFNDFRAADGALLARLAPHLDQSLTNWLLLERERAAHEQAANGALDLGVFWLWLDATGRIIDAAPGTEAIIEAATDVKVTAGRIEPVDPHRARALRRMIDDSVGGSAAPELSLAPDLRLMLFPGLHHPSPGMDPVLRGVLRKAPQAQTLDLAQLAHHLGVSRSEARLAALICDGLSLKDAALALGWTIETTRSASKRLYQLTGCSGQSALMRRMQTGTQWFQELPRREKPDFGLAPTGARK